ncbi:DNA polymerase III subunit gamma/tau [Planctomycetota bacterium]
MSYTVLARKYRSLTFADVIGQDSVTQTLKNAIGSGRVAHAYLFSGTRGVGKTTLARILAKALNCLKTDGPTVTPCCKCDSCLAINTGEDIDVIEIDGASNNGVDQVRELRDNAIYRPARARHKIYIIDEVHMLTVAAFNALLKILEEPPDHVKFIFATTEPHKVIATIQSRCQRFDFRNISTTDIAGHLKTILKQEKIKAEDNLVLAVAKMANGSMRDGLSLLDRLISVGITPLKTDLLEEYLGIPSAERVYDLIGAIGSSDAGAALTQLDGLITSGLSEPQLVDALIDSMRDLMVLKTAGGSENLVILTADQRQRAQSLAADFDVAALVYAIASLEKLRWSIKNSDSPRTLLEASLLRFTLSEHFLNVDTLLAQLNQQPGTAVKKKHIPEPAQPVASRPRPNQAPAPARAVTPTVEPSPPLEPPRLTGELPTLDKVKQCWHDVQETLQTKLGAGTASLLHNAQPISCAAGLLTLQFAPQARVQQEMCQSNGRTDQIQQVIAVFFDCPLRVTFTVDEPQPIQEIPAQSNSPLPKPQSKRNELLNDPTVKAVLMGLDATVTGIEENNQ